MKEYSIKPIRIRFVSGGIECMTLSQMKKSFSLKDIKDQYPQFLKWLKQNNEDDFVKKFEELDLEGNDIDSLYNVYKLFFDDYIKSKHIENLGELYEHWSKDYQYSNSLTNLKEEIRRHEWGNSFLFSLVEKRIDDEDKIERENLFNIYYSVIKDNESLSPITNLVHLYIHFYHDSSSKQHFIFLDKKIKKQDWQTEFFLEVIPEFFQHENHGESAVQLYELYSTRLTKLFKEKKIQNLTDLYRLFLSDTNYNEAYKILHNEIKAQRSWGTQFFFKFIPLLFHKENMVTVQNKYFSTANEGDVFRIYNYFLEDYFVHQTKGRIKNFRHLYCFLHQQENNKERFWELHHFIVQKNWGVAFVSNSMHYILDEYIKKNGNEKTFWEDYIVNESNIFKFFSTYFQYYFKKENFNNLSDLYIKWAEDSLYNKTQCFAYLEDILIHNIWGVWKLLDIYKKYKSIAPKEKWRELFKEIAEIHSNSDRVQYEVGKLCIDDYHDFWHGCHLLDTAQSQGNKDASQYLRDLRKRENSVSNEFRGEYTSSNRLEWTAHSDGKNFQIDERLKKTAISLHEKWILTTQELIHRIIKEGAWGKIYESINFLANIKSQKNMPYGYNLDNPLDFLGIFERCNDLFDTKRKEMLREVAKYHNESFIEIRFVLALICRGDSPEDFRDIGTQILNSIADIYIPAKHLIDENHTDPQLRKLGFRQKVNDNTNEALKVFCSKIMPYPNYICTKTK